MKCKLILNKDSGNCARLDTNALLANLGKDVEMQIIDSHTEWSADDFDTVVVCGGDGTLHNAIEKCKGKRLMYAPCGTLNETAHTESTICTLGKVNDSLFSYVCATGSFTEIGYTADNGKKKRWKALAYLPQIFKSYHCKQIAAKLNVDGVDFDGTYTLLMVLKSHRCFGFPFNKQYKTTKKNYILAVKAVGDDSFKNKCKLFFPFFRIFFCGANPKVAKNWLLLPFDNLTMELTKPQDFCVDGERRQMSGCLHFSQFVPSTPITVLKTPYLSRKHKKCISNSQTC